MHIAASERTRVRPLRGRVGWVQRDQVNFVLREFPSQRGVNVSPCTHLAAEWGGKEIAPAERAAARIVRPSSELKRGAMAAVESLAVDDFICLATYW